ncbi:hypothetical protein NDU88_000380 [Pleurodeles waltl]|uniref:Uncharacterized protein n=1 Tax=Pleurodeles waltl TaxID=8319 RepID=A0AAV7WJC5_PLEWA|nr:hypothetical protein NDU88_000380 [Pleurodeles waltl]
MSGGRGPQPTQQTKLDKYALPHAKQGRLILADTRDGAAHEDEETPTLNVFLVVIQGVKGVLELKIDSVSMELTLVHADLRNIRVCVKDTEDSLSSLQADTAFLKTQVKDMCATMESLGAKQEVIEGHSRCNNIRLVGVRERADGPATALFVKDIILNKLKPQRPSKYFSVKRARIGPGAPPRLKIPLHNNSPHLQL